MSLSSASGLIMTLHYLGVTLHLDGENLRVRGKEGVLTARLRAAIAEEKAELLQILSVPAHAEHLRFVTDGLAVFRGAALQDEETWVAFRDLAQRHFGHLDVWDRISCSFRGIAEIICILGEKQPADVVTIARLRGCADRLEKLCDALRDRENRQAAPQEAPGEVEGLSGPAEACRRADGDAGAVSVETGGAA